MSNIGSCVGASNQLQAALISAATPCDLSTFTVLDCNSGSSIDFTLTATANPSTQYYVQVDGDESVLPAAECNFDIDISGVGVQYLVTLTTTPPSCPTVCDGTISAVVSGGQSAYNYLWSNSSTSSSITSCSGNFTVTVTDSETCTALATTTLTDPLALVLTPTISHPTCFGSADGTVSTSTSGGTGAITFLWSDTQTGSPAINMAKGIYTVTGTDANSCTTTTEVTLIEPDEIIPSSYNNTNDLCQTGNGSTEIPSVSGGTGPGTYSYIWTDGQTEIIASNLTGGSTIRATVTDANGCTTVSAGTTVGNDVLPAGTANGNPLTVEKGESANLSSDYHTSATYSWSPTSYQSAVITSPSNKDVWIANLQETTTFSVIMQYGTCVDEEEDIPNAFSPNGDGWNDVWIINKIEAYPNNEVKVYNRWGQIVYEQIGYGADNAFNGRRRGQDLPEGTYYFIIELNTTFDVIKKVFQGTLAIIR
ncbi:MAG: gliding motility-associated C-terminal domain-containing protein [Bacteroidetes bacterium]|nr:gliding motility-associated C-terminal domain-containing protein [Bacteroidota bacterium]